ncbi:MAG: hypothetical protein HYZ00_08790, partial [Candidatus Hydrogenedentes bacterium]|nr:hypothetical protein [Candidatus Hydrogenedentota bacterium]
MIDFVCPHCGQHTSAPETLAGQRTACAACRQTVRVPRFVPRGTVAEAAPKSEGTHSPAPGHARPHAHEHSHGHGHPHEHEHSHEHHHEHDHPLPPASASTLGNAAETVETLLRELSEERKARARLESRLQQVERELRQAQTAADDSARSAAQGRLELASLAVRGEEVAVRKPDYSGLEVWLAEARLRADDAAGLLAPASSPLETLTVMARLSGVGKDDTLASARTAIDAAEARAAYNASQVKRLTEELAAARAEQMRTAARLREIEDRLERTEARATDAYPFETESQATYLDPSLSVASFETPSALFDWERPAAPATPELWAPLPPAESPAIRPAAAPEVVAEVAETAPPSELEEVLAETPPVLSAETTAPEAAPATYPTFNEAEFEAAFRREAQSALEAATSLESALEAWGTDELAPPVVAKPLAPAEAAPSVPVPPVSTEQAPAEMSELEHALSAWWAEEEAGTPGGATAVPRPPSPAASTIADVAPVLPAVAEAAPRSMEIEAAPPALEVAAVLPSGPPAPARPQDLAAEEEEWPHGDSHLREAGLEPLDLAWKQTPALDEEEDQEIRVIWRDELEEETATSDEEAGEDRDFFAETSSPAVAEPEASLEPVPVPIEVEIELAEVAAEAEPEVEEAPAPIEAEIEVAEAAEEAEPEVEQAPAPIEAEIEVAELAPEAEPEVEEVPAPIEAEFEVAEAAPEAEPEVEVTPAPTEAEVEVAEVTPEAVPEVEEAPAPVEAEIEVTEPAPVVGEKPAEAAAEPEEAVAEPEPAYKPPAPPAKPLQEAARVTRLPMRPIAAPQRGRSMLEALQAWGGMSAAPEAPVVAASVEDLS